MSFFFWSNINFIQANKVQSSFATGAREEIGTKAALAKESARTFAKCGIKTKEIDSRKWASTWISWSTPLRATSCHWVFKSIVRFFESELTVRLLTWRETAAVIATLTARASATRAEDTDRRCEEEHSAMEFPENSCLIERKLSFQYKPF